MPLGGSKGSFRVLCAGMTVFLSLHRTVRVHIQEASVVTCGRLLACLTQASKLTNRLFWSLVPVDWKKAIGRLLPHPRLLGVL